MKNKMAYLRTMTAALALGFAGTVTHAALVTIPQSALNASPGVYTPNGYYTNNLGPNIVTTGGTNWANVGQADGRNVDGFMALDLGFNFTYFGITYDSLFVNNNGHVSFNAGSALYTPNSPTGSSYAAISPFFGDVDTFHNPSSGVVHYNLTAEELIVTWDNVGYFYHPG
jgi:hypothetical protein